MVVRLSAHVNDCWQAGTGGCEFGAEQVVLVRDAAAKRRLVDRVGTGMLVLTVHECKGLEFQVKDVTVKPQKRLEIIIT